MKRFLLPILAAVVLVTGLIQPTVASAAEPQWRSYWVNSIDPGIFNASQVAQVVADAQAANTNALIVQVVRRFECYCNDSDYVRSTDPKLQSGFDPLAEFIRLGHAAGLEVHAWVNVNTFWNESAPPSNPQHPFNTNGPTESGAERWINQRNDGYEGTATRYLDLANPAAQDHTATMIQSIVANYDVDGINLDFIRYPDYTGTGGNPWGYSETSLQRFNQATGSTGTPAANNAQFSQFRRDQVTTTVRKIRSAVNAVAPHKTLSINGIAYGNGPTATRRWESTDPYASVFQDWRGWAREGIIDAVILMNYKNEANASHATMFRQWNEFLAQVQEETGRLMVSGTGLWLNTRENSLKQANAVTSLGLGWAGYVYSIASSVANSSSAARASERAALASALETGPFRDVVGVPLMPWKTGYEGDLYTTPGHHFVNGREWRTSCEAYSQTRRCRTDIRATTVTFSGGQYVKTFDWTFNNLTYVPLMTRQQWGTNPLANNGEFTSSSRPWRTECDTANTGRGGCRSYVMSYGVVQAEQRADGTWRYFRADKWVFNNIVRFAGE